MRLTLLTAVGLALISGLLPGSKPLAQVAEASRGGTSGQTPKTADEAAPAQPAGK